jgi:hypothetical protein
MTSRKKTMIPMVALTALVSGLFMANDTDARGFGGGGGGGFSRILLKNSLLF